MPTLILAITLFIIGISGILLSIILVLLPLNTACLSMNNITGSVKEHYQGLSSKKPWSTLGKKIDMTASIIVTSGGILIMSWEEFMINKFYKEIPTRIYEAKDSIIYGSWATAIRPRKGKLSILLLKTPQLGALMVMAEIETILSDYVKKRTTDEVLGEKENINNMIANHFGGKNEEASSEMEDEYGVIISNPKLFDFNLGVKSQESSEKLFETKKFRESLEELKGLISDPEKAAEAVLVATGMAKKEIYDFGKKSDGGQKDLDLATAFFVKGGNK